LVETARVFGPCDEAWRGGQLSSTRPLLQLSAIIDITDGVQSRASSSLAVGEWP